MVMRKLITGLAVFGLSASALSEGGADKSSHHDAKAGAKLSPPSSIKKEHEELHEKLHHLVGIGGKTGSAAKEVARLLQPHFEKEEKFALPPLRQLSELSEGRTPSDSAETVRLTDQFKRELPQMLNEHKAVVGALQRLKDAAKAEGKQEAVAFADALEAHATLEEEVLYPTALLIGKYLKEKGK